jgi:phospholipid/cholesterol/gamma-HCH transport system permease protein
MNASPIAPTAIAESTPQGIVLSGSWTARGVAAMETQFAKLAVNCKAGTAVNGVAIEALDTTGAWAMQKLLRQLSGGKTPLSVENLRPEFARLLQLAGQRVDAQMKRPEESAVLAAAADSSQLAGIGRSTLDAIKNTIALFAFVGECSEAFAGCVAHPTRIRWRPILYNIRSAGFDALPIIGLLSFLLGIVVAYQGSGQLRQYGANIFVTDLVGLSMLREFAPLMTAIIIAGRSGSSYAAQIGTMAVTEEIDAMRTIGIAPLEMLVLPKIIALLIVLPLLTVFADVLGVFGGMLMARTRLDVGFVEFVDRFVKTISMTDFLIGIGKAPIFAVIITVVGCFQGFRTEGGADSVGRQTTRSVVQASFLVIVADALFSIAFSALDL